MRPKLLLSITLLIFISLTGCQKELSSIQGSIQNSQSSADGSVVINHNIDGTTTLTLRPGKDGQDANVLYFEGRPDQMDANFNYQHVLETYAWTDGGTPITRRSFIRFDSLAKVPDTARIISAKLYLYGALADSEAPQGNSSYPGTPYAPYDNNTCYVERVVKPWTETTITWNNQPLITQLNRTTLGPSNVQWGYNTSVDVTKLVRPMVKKPLHNYGFRISLQSETFYKSILFYSSEISDGSKRPKLVITYK
jgi:hypothetical protein